jgi:hypothetical protein
MHELFASRFLTYIPMMAILKAMRVPLRSEFHSQRQTYEKKIGELRAKGSSTLKTTMCFVAFRFIEINLHCYGSVWLCRPLKFTVEFAIADDYHAQFSARDEISPAVLARVPHGGRSQRRKQR